MSKTPETIGELYRTLKNQVGTETRFQYTEELVSELIEDDESGKLLYEVGTSMSKNRSFSTLVQVLFNTHEVFVTQSSDPLQRLNTLENLAAHSEVILTNHPEATRIRQELSRLVSLLIYFEQSINQAQETPIKR